jgi:hypothetical protein
MTTFNDTLNSIMELSFQERNEIIDIVRKRQSQEWRIETAEYFHTLRNEVLNGDLVAMDIEEAIEELNRLQNEDEE